MSVSLPIPLPGNKWQSSMVESATDDARAHTRSGEGLSSDDGEVVSPPRRRAAPDPTATAVVHFQGLLQSALTPQPINVVDAPAGGLSATGPLPTGQSAAAAAPAPAMASSALRGGPLNHARPADSATVEVARPAGSLPAVLLATHAAQRPTQNLPERTSAAQRPGVTGTSTTSDALPQVALTAVPNVTATPLRAAAAAQLPDTVTPAAPQFTAQQSLSGMGTAAITEFPTLPAGAARTGGVTLAAGQTGTNEQASGTVLLPPQILAPDTATEHSSRSPDRSTQSAAGSFRADDLPFPDGETSATGLLQSVTAVAEPFSATEFSATTALTPPAVQPRTSDMQLSALGRMRDSSASDSSPASWAGEGAVSQNGQSDSDDWQSASLPLAAAVDELRTVPISTTGHAAPLTAGLTDSVTRELQLPLSSQVSQAIYEQLQSSRAHNDSQLTLRLDPPDLGELVISLSRSEDGIAVRVTAREPVTMDMLLARGSEIEQQLRGKDLDLSSLEFLSPDFASGGFDRSSQQSDSGAALAERVQRAAPRRTSATAGAEAASVRGAETGQSRASMTQRLSFRA